MSSITLKKFFIADNYITRIKQIQKKIKILELEKLKISKSDFNFIWRIDSKFIFNGIYNRENKYSVFGKEIKFSSIDWHQDNFSSFKYPLKRFDRINAAQYFNKGIDLVFPWEQSRFYFGINLANKYLVSKDEDYYFIFKSLIEDWIEKNPFLYGVNWLSTMDVSIRSVNWIVALNLFSEVFSKETLFKNKITNCLLKHAEYISQFPLIEKGGLTTNHTTSAYTGLLFLSLTLKKHTKSENWIKIAKKGLETCIEEQVYDDGVDFEGSIPYHRLVLEFFAYSAIIAKANNVKFSKFYYQKLFKMFEFCTVYMDKNGNAPQIGDNDSGRLLIFNDINNDPYENEHNHRYLLSLGSKIFDYEFDNNSPAKDITFDAFLPEIEKINISDNNIVVRDIDKLQSFDNGGAYFLKNEIFELCFANFSTGQNGKGGHNHLDTGGFTLSLEGIPIIVDPGSYGYSRDRIERDKYRSYTYHNTIFNDEDFKTDLSKNGYWSLENPYSGEIVSHSASKLNAKITLVSDKNIRYRKFELLERKLNIDNCINGNFSTRLNFHPSAEIKILEVNQLLINQNYKIIFNSQIIKMNLDSYSYSPFYGKSEKAHFLIVEGKDNINFDIVKVTA